MKKFGSKISRKKIQSSLQALPSMGIAFVVLGILVFASTFIFSIRSNALLLTGLFLVIAGCLGYVYSLKKDRCSFEASILLSFNQLMFLLKHYSCSGAINLYPLPWILIISICGSSFKCLRNLVI